MGLGIFRKVGDFFKKTWKKAKPILKKVVMPIVKTAAPLLTSAIPQLKPYAPMVTGLTNIADNAVNGTAGNLKSIASQVKQTVSPFIKLRKNNAAPVPAAAPPIDSGYDEDQF